MGAYEFGPGGSGRVGRGGDWDNDEDNAGVSYLVSAGPSGSDHGIGFPVARSSGPYFNSLQNID